MTKTLLFNGCSFTAGDELVWHEYNTQYLWKSMISTPLDDQPVNLGKDERRRLIDDYTANFRPTRNLAAQCAEILQTAKFDLSVDGNSNHSIVYQTISYLEHCSIQEQQNIHVCIGWTEFSRRYKWSEQLNCMSNIHRHWDYDKSLKEYIDYCINDSDITDQCVNYIQHVLTLQNYLESKNITYTFWRTLGYFRSDFTDTAFKNISNNNYFTLPIDMLSDSNNWLSFDDNTIHPLIGDPWLISFSTNDIVADNNWHPKLNKVKELSQKICCHIKNTQSKFF